MFPCMFTIFIQVTLADQQGNPNSPLYSVKTFQELGLYVLLPQMGVSIIKNSFRRPDLLKGIFSMGFDKPSKIQEKALPLLLVDP
jgi:ATP-dependent RNA helicase DDX19/DBP5